MKKRIIVASLLSVGVMSAFAGTKQPSIKEMVEGLQQAVVSIQKDLIGEHMWANDVNDSLNVLNQRTLDLNRRLHEVESRGPVAQAQ